MKREGIKRYIPVTIFTALLVTIIYELAYTYKWWELKVTIVPWGYITNVSYAYGSFLIGTMWIFYFTFKKFWLFLVANIIADGIDAFLIREFMELRGIIHYINLSNWNLFIVMVALSLIAFGFQVWQEKTFKLKESGT
ncbi:hypothetical protein ACE38V_20145 [Cytobacillus sp. Hz8]|uniref:hypothetical protein n=1 Tax=Cytobacillus sp. Hz8 TaxID=3347168 RepID=UPI0035D670B2